MTRRIACISIVIGAAALASLDSGALAEPPRPDAEPPAAEPAPAATADAAATRTPEPWRVGKAAGVPGWLRVGLEQRTRAEHLANDFRAMATGDATAVSLRTLVMAEATARWVTAGIEIQDSRAFASDTTPLNTTLVNPLELLQLYVGIKRTSALVAGDAVDARVGRITIDLGTRRLVARNAFRNTISGFTGVDASWVSPGKHVARGFVAVPVTRLPADPDGLDDNTIELDEESTDALLWATAYGSPRLALGTHLELFVVGFHERDGELPSRNRQLLTGGLRWLRKPGPGAADFDIEAMPQLGSSRATTAPEDTADLDHRALSTHVEAGFSPALGWKPRLALQHDFATGDRDPADGAMGRFDLLFGARRFDFGPTGIYGAFARGNLQSPGIRLSIAPAAKLDALVSYRLFWLAAKRDAWTTAGLKDSSGTSGRFLGEQIEVQLRWTPLLKNVSIEAGAAYLRRGQFAGTAPEARTDPAAYLYAQVTVTI